MFSLVLDSATKVLYVCLVENDKVIYEKYIEGQNDHAKSIVFCVDEALKKANITAKDLSKVVVGFGPGSYTGVRMAVTVAKMLAVFMKTPLYTISTLELMASGSTNIVKSTVDARRGNAFGAVYDLANNQVILQDGLYSYEDLNNYCCDHEVKENIYKVDPIYCINHAKEVKEPHLLTPNYLRETEAERNLK